MGGGSMSLAATGLVGGGRGVAFEGVDVAPRVSVDVNAVAMLGEAIDESHDAGCAWKDGTPLLEREVGGDDAAPFLMPAGEDVVEDVGGPTVAGQRAELVQDQEVRAQVAFEAAFEGWDGFLAQEVRQRCCQRGEADGVA